MPIDALRLNATYLRARPGTRPASVSHPFGVLSEEQLDHARATRMEVWAYSPLLTGVYDNPDKQLDEVYRHEGNTRRHAALDEVSAELGISRNLVVLAWLTSHGVRPILGGRRLEQLDAALDAVARPLSPEHPARLDGAR